MADINKKSSKEIEKAIVKEQNAVPYTPSSICPPIGTVVPISLYGETVEAFSVLKEAGIQIDEYLLEKLKYTSKITLCSAFSAEQADALALAIFQIEKGNGFIIGDMAGIGKGRINAGILRYAYLNGMIPIFITEKPNLFTDIYRDIKDIGGFRMEKDGSIFIPKPLILNGYKSGGFDYTFDDKGNRIKIKKPAETSIIDEATGKEMIIAPEQDKIEKIIKKGVLPEQYGFIILTYSQLSGKSAVRRQKYLASIAPNAIFSLDECHNAAGTKSSVGLFFQTVLPMTKGVLFSSATYAKRADNMYLYATKTSIRESSIGVKSLLEAIQEGGDKLLEYLASNLVSSGQMIRRGRTYDNCGVNYLYMPESQKDELYQKYDNAINALTSLMEFSESSIFREAKKKAVQRFADLNKVVLAKDKPSDKKEREEWEKNNIGNYKLENYTAGEISSIRFHFIETLLFALKAEFVADLAIQELLDRNSENNTSDGEKIKSNRKPIIAVRNTVESIYDSLGIQLNTEVPKGDFSIYVEAIAKSMRTGMIRLKKITDDEEKEKDKLFLKESDYQILESDFPDNGEEYRKTLKAFEEISFELPLSPIDYIIQKIESVERPAWDNYGDGKKHFRVGEITGRKYNLFKNEEGKYILYANRKEKNKYLAFKKFNDGIYDVLLINESGSTGGSAHSSSKFKDQRPRSMVIHQVELDVNTEVQKRGRINRTGQIFYPTYIYAVSRIPTEIRRLLMLKKKLRSLDANVSANQKQSSKMVDIKDKSGNSIEDFFNEYGAKVLDEFLSQANHSHFLQYDKDYQDNKEIYSLDFIDRLNHFMRNLELAPSKDQEYFYDIMNQNYVREIKKAIEDKIYDLETEIEDLKSSLKTRMVITKNTNTSAFTSSVFEEDNYVLRESNPYTKEKVNDLINELAAGKNPDKYHQEFITEYKRYYKEEFRKQIKNTVKVPNYELAKDDVEKKAMEAEYRDKIRITEERADEEFEYLLKLFSFFTPRKKNSHTR